MRFSAIAVSAAVFGVAMAIPASIVYETEIVTITSCAPEKTNCPGRTQTSAVAVATPVVAPVASSAAVVVIPASSAAAPSAAAPSAAAPSAAAPSAAAPSSAAPSVIVIRPISSAPAPSAVPVSYPNGTVSASAIHPSVVVSTLQWVPSASAGLPSAPGNTSVPIVPATPSLTPASGASTNGLSFAAAAIAAAAFIFA